MLEQVPGQHFEMLVLDAYSSDSIPVHLATLEAFKLYVSRLKPGGLLVIHGSNRYIDLTRILGPIFKRLGLTALERTRVDEASERPFFAFNAEWIVASTDSSMIEGLRKEGWTPLPDTQKHRTWTDDFSNILSVLK